MSRSSKGFADFFPTAPSVLQQKRSRTAQDRKRRETPPVLDGSPLPVSSDLNATSVSHVDRGGHLLPNGTNADHAMPDALPIAHEEIEPVPGDLLNGVGSASSTSTVSSVFSSHNPPLDSNQRGKFSHSTLTPLTNDHSSPPGVNKSPAYAKQEPRSNSSAQTLSKPLSPKRPRPPNMTTSLNSRNFVQARPGNGEPKGVRIIYDPELDKSISSKERRSRQARYKDIPDDVGFGFALPIFPYSYSYVLICYSYRIMSLHLRIHAYG